MKTKKFTIRVSDPIGSVSAEATADDGMDCLYVFAHGAGAGMNHPFMVTMSKALAELNIGTLRYNFPYMEKGGRRPDVPAVAEKTVGRAIETALEMFAGVPLLAGGKSFGGRMTSQAMSKVPDTPVKGIVFVGFPLHAPGKPGTDRAGHLANITVPMLFLQGSRDALADIRLVEQVCEGLPGAFLRIFEGADHSFRSGKRNLIPDLASAIRQWWEAGK